MTMKILRSSTAGHVPSSLADGQLAINQADGLLFWKDSGGTIRSVNLLGTPGGGYGYFRAYRNGTQSGLTSNAYNKVQLNAETVDSQNIFDSTTNYRCTPNSSGWWFFHGSVQAPAGSNGPPQAVLYKNGSLIDDGSFFAGSTSGTQYSNVTAIMQMNGSSDYTELFVFVGTGVTTVSGSSSATRLIGFKLN